MNVRSVRWALARRLRSLARQLRRTRSKPLRYFLEVYEPGSRGREAAGCFDSSTPFASIAVGDVLNPAFWPTCIDPMTLLRVVKVEHIVWTVPSPAQKTCIYTEAVAP